MIVICSEYNNINGYCTIAVIRLYTLFLRATKASAEDPRVVFLGDRMPSIDAWEDVVCLGCPPPEVLEALAHAASVQIVCCDDDNEWRKSSSFVLLQPGFRVELYQDTLGSASTCVLSWYHFFRELPMPEVLKLISTHHLYPLHDSSYTHDPAKALCVSIDHSLRAIALRSASSQDYWNRLFWEPVFVKEEIELGKQRLRDQQLLVNEQIARLSSIPDHDLYHQSPLNPDCRFTLVNADRSLESAMAAELLKYDTEFVVTYRYDESIYVANVTIWTRNTYYPISTLSQLLKGNDRTRRIDSLTLDNDNNTAILKIRGSPVDIAMLFVQSV